MSLVVETTQGWSVSIISLPAFLVMFTAITSLLHTLVWFHLGRLFVYQMYHQVRTILRPHFADCFGNNFPTKTRPLTLGNWQCLQIAKFNFVNVYFLSRFICWGLRYITTDLLSVSSLKPDWAQCSKNRHDGRAVIKIDLILFSTWCTISFYQFDYNIKGPIMLSAISRIFRRWVVSLFIITLICDPISQKMLPHIKDYQYLIRNCHATIYRTFDITYQLHI